jgi:inorganic pyrophosphatase
MVNSTKFLGKRIKVIIDRPLGSSHPVYGFKYLVNYGYIDGVKAPDGENLDAYVLGVNRPLETFEGECIAVIHRLDENDDKLIVVPSNFTYSNEEIRTLTGFQERFFRSTIIRK